MCRGHCKEVSLDKFSAVCCCLGRVGFGIETCVDVGSCAIIAIQLEVDWPV